MTALQPQGPEQPQNHEREPMLPPTEGAHNPDIRASRGIGSRAMKKLGFDEASLAEAGVLRANSAQTAEDAARGIGQPSDLSGNAQVRANAIASLTPENIEPVDERSKIAS